MKRNTVLFILFVASVVNISLGQKRSPTPADSMRNYFNRIDKQILEMAKDFPEDKYDFKLKPEMRSFGAVLVHVASGNVYAAKIGKGEKAQWSELDAKQYPTKTDVVALLERAFGDSEAALKAKGDDDLATKIEPWISVMEHNAEHYGLLVAYYRANGLVPPASRGGRTVAVAKRVAPNNNEFWSALGEPNGIVRQSAYSRPQELVVSCPQVSMKRL